MANLYSPIIPWMGGKRRLAKHLLPLFPEHSCYVEPFCGGAALFFMRPKRAKSEVLNDINGDIINLYRVVQHHYEAFVQQFDWALASRETFAHWQIARPETLTDIQRAARFAYLQHNAFGGKISGRNFGTSTVGRAWSADYLRRLLAAAHQRLDGVTIERLPWHDCVQRYDRPHSFFYADPPYWQTAGYGVPFGWEEYERLAQTMAQIEGKMMLSINDHPDIRELFKDYRTHEISLTYKVGGNKKPKAAQELIICNW